MSAGNVLFRADGGQRLGLGHIKRCEALCRELARRNISCSFLTQQEDFVTAYIRDAGFEAHTIEPVPPDDREEMFSRTVDAVDKLRPDVVFLDILNTTVDFVQKLQGTGARVASIDDLGPGGAVVDALVGVDVGMLNENLPQSVLDSDPAHIHAGLDYAIMDPAFTALRDMKTEQHFHERNIFVGFGGSDPCGTTVPVVQALMDWDQDFHVDIVLGPCMADPDAAADLAARHAVRFTVHRDPPDLPHIMARAAVAVCGVGQSLFELTMLGTPCLLVTQSPLHAQFGANFQKCGAAAHLGPHPDFSPEIMLQWCDRILSDLDLWKRMSEIARSTIDGRGVVRICDVIQKLLEK